MESGLSKSVALNNESKRGTINQMEEEKLRVYNNSIHRESRQLAH